MRSVWAGARAIYCDAPCEPDPHCTACAPCEPSQTYFPAGYEMIIGTTYSIGLGDFRLGDDPLGFSSAIYWTYGFGLPPPGPSLGAFTHDTQVPAIAIGAGQPVLYLPPWRPTNA